MRTFEQWMDEYGSSHQNITNQLIHKICVPLITLTVIGFLWAIPKPEVFSQIPYLNWGTIFVFGCIIFYATLNFKMALAMILQSVIMVMIVEKLETQNILISFCVITFVIAWIFQFIGHKIEGKKPSFFKDLVFLLIGPLWVLRFAFKMVGMKI